MSSNKNFFDNLIVFEIKLASILAYSCLLDKKFLKRNPLKKLKKKKKKRLKNLNFT
jgi:hypothetical protein